MRRIALLVLSLPCVAVSAIAGPLSIRSDLGVQGVYRYCEYNNGKVYMVEAGSTCPSTIQEPAANGKGIGFFKSESHEGTSKLCIYRVSGQDRSIRVETNASCPLNQEF